jgi:hypothetical protein
MFPWNRIHATIKNCVFRVVRAEGYKKQKRLFESVEFRDATLPGCELGSGQLK